MTEFQTHPDRYKHWRLRFDGPIARLDMAVDPKSPHSGDYELKLNSYDLGVDIELHDAVQRIRFEHPEVAAVVVSSVWERIFCAGANIRMLGASSHPFKVNFCKFTNETRLAIEDASRRSGITWIAALNGTTAGGGYELALACDEIYLVDDKNSAVSLPEVPLLGVLPGTGGLTRLVDKRKVRRDLADVFCTLGEGVKGKKAKDWGLVDDVFPRSVFADRVAARARELAARKPRADRGITLEPLEIERDGDDLRYRYAALEVDRAARTARLTLAGPGEPQPDTPEGYVAAGSESWALRAFRELDDLICRLRFDYEEVGVVTVETRGDPESVLAVERVLAEHRGHWLIDEIVGQIARTLKRFELTGRSFFALAGPESCFAGLLLEVGLACDRLYALDDPERPVTLAVGPLSAGALPMSNGLSRLESRFLGEPTRAARLAETQPVLSAREAAGEGLVTLVFDDIDWDDEIRIAVEERASLSPDALTGMEASLRFCGPETMETKIFGRLSAWQNWVFTRPNATGERGALTCYGRPESPSFDWRRT